MDVSLAPYVPTQHDIVKRMLEISKTGLDDVVFDLGCGDGRILLSAVKDFGAKKAIGYKMRNDLYRQGIAEVASQNLQERDVLMNCDLMSADLSEATVITLYLTISGNEQLKPKLTREMRKGTRIVSHDFELKGWRPSVIEDFRGHSIYLYVAPDAFSSDKTF